MLTKRGGGGRGSISWSIYTRFVVVKWWREIDGKVYRARALETRVITVYLNDMHRECWPCNCVNACLAHTSRFAASCTRFRRNRVQLCEKGSGNRAGKEDQSDSEIPLTSPRERDHDGNRMDPCCPMSLEGYRGWNTSSLVFFNRVAVIVTTRYTVTRKIFVHFVYKRDKSIEIYLYKLYIWICLFFFVFFNSIYFIEPK